MRDTEEFDCGRLQVVLDPVADALDDMAALGQHWTRNRERGRMPSGIRAAMLLVAREVLAHADMQEREIQRKFSETRTAGCRVERPLGYGKTPMPRHPDTRDD